MKTNQINDTQKVITAENGKVLTNGGEFANYPIELVVNVADNSWYEIDKPEEIVTHGEIPYSYEDR